MLCVEDAGVISEVTQITKEEEASKMPLHYSHATVRNSNQTDYFTVYPLCLMCFQGIFLSDQHCCISQAERVISLRKHDKRRSGFLFPLPLGAVAAFSLTLHLFPVTFRDSALLTLENLWLHKNSSAKVDAPRKICIFADKPGDYTLKIYRV